MKGSVALMVAAVLPYLATADPLRIVAFTTDTIAWTNATVGDHVGIEMGWDLSSRVWCPFAYWDQVATSQSTRLDWPLDRINFEAVSAFVGAQMPPVFFRVITSPEHLDYSVWTNQVAIRNAATDPASNLVVGVMIGTEITQTQSVSRLEPGAQTKFAFTQEMSWFVVFKQGPPFRVEYLQTGTVCRVDFYPTILPFVQTIGD